MIKTKRSLKRNAKVDLILKDKNTTTDEIWLWKPVTLWTDEHIEEFVFFCQ
jgi:hypothetical protein